MSGASSRTAVPARAGATVVRSLALPFASVLALGVHAPVFAAVTAPAAVVGDEDEGAPPLAWGEGLLGEATALSLRHAELGLEADGPVYQATLSLDFRNTAGRTVEGVAWLPIAADALERGFVVDNGGTVMQGKVRSRDLVVRAYRNITRPNEGRGRDPVVLERIDEHWLRATVFPVAPNADVKIQVSYLGTSEALGGLRRLDVPMPESRGEAGGIVSFDLAGRVHGEAGDDFSQYFLAAPGSTIIDRRIENTGLAFDARVPLHHGGRATLVLGSDGTGDRLDLHCYRVADEHGYFYAELDPAALLAERLEAVDWCVVLDDASLEPTAWNEVRRQLENFAALLPETAGLSILTSADERRNLEVAAPRLVDAAVVADWKVRLDAPRSRGVSRLPALLDRARQTLALGDLGRTARVLVVAGAAPSADDEVAVRDSFRQLGHVRADSSVFVLGTGELARDERLATWALSGAGRGLGAADESEIGLLLDSLRRSAEHPVLIAPKIDMAGATETVMDLPRVVVHGDKIRWSGRYEQPSRSVVRLRGHVSGNVREIAASADLSADDYQNPWVATLWAGRRLEQLRSLTCAPGTDSVTYYETRLSERFGLLGPNTVAFGVEPGLESFMPRLVGPQNRPAAGGNSPFEPLGPPPPRVGPEGPVTAAQLEDRGRRSLPGVLTGAGIPGHAGQGGMTRPAPVAPRGR